jgi:FKBP-type peptidyl-prolyl cis-trans isomerase
MFLTGTYIEGLNQGLMGMQAGGSRRLVIPGHLAYEDNPPPRLNVQPDETIYATIDCLRVFEGPNVSLPSGLRFESDGAGEGPAARFGSWVACHVLLMAGTEQRVVFDSQAKAGLIEIGLPAPPGINVGRRLDPEIPWLGPALYGIRAGEFRTVHVPAARAFGGRGYVLLGIKPGEPVTYEITCDHVQEGPDIQLESGMRLENLQVGDGRFLRAGQWATFREELALEDGTVVFSNLADSDPVSVSLIPRVGPTGWNRGVIGMREGGVRRLTIPPALAYGDQSPRDLPIIPPGATLTFTMHLLEVHRRGPAPPTPPGGAATR